MLPAVTCRAVQMGGGGYHIDPDTSGGNLPGAAERDDGRFCGSSDHQVLAGLAGLDGVRGKDRGEEEKNIPSLPV